MSAEASEVASAVNQLADEYRSRCLWFLRADFYPETDVDRLTVLAYIERYGDRAAFQKAAAVRQWLSRTSNERSAVS